MRRRTQHNADTPGLDSFLDIVANMVGILVILVMLVGVRVKNAPAVVAAIPNGNRQLAAELEKDLAAERSLRRDVLKVAGEIQNLQNETLLQGPRRDILAAAVSSWEHELRTRRQQMDAETQAAFDLKLSVSESQAQLQQLARRRLAAERAPPKSIVVESYPTPLSRLVHGHEAHFQLRGGLISPIPFDEFLDQLKSEFRQKKWKLRDRPEITETIGPIRGFRLRYTLARHDISPETAMELGYGGRVVRLEHCTFIPVSGRMGETIDAALSEGSEFRRALAKFHPGRSTVTLWTYADSFASFRRLKKALYQSGYAVAARPLPIGVPITASPEGTKSAAE